MNDHFGVAAGAEHKPQLGQLGNQFLIVIDLAVVYDDDRPILVIERLLAGSQIDDREPPMPEPNAWRKMQSTLVRTAMMLRLVHSHQHVSLNRSPRVQINNGNNAAHG